MVRITSSVGLRTKVRSPNLGCLDLGSDRRVHHCTPKKDTYSKDPKLHVIRRVFLYCVRLNWHWGFWQELHSLASLFSKSYRAYNAIYVLLLMMIKRYQQSVRTFFLQNKKSLQITPPFYNVSFLL